MEQKALDAWDSQSPAIRLCQPGSHPLSHAQLLAPQQVQTDGRADVANEQASQEDGERARETERERESERARKKERDSVVRACKMNANPENIKLIHLFTPWVRKRMTFFAH